MARRVKSDWTCPTPAERREWRQAAEVLFGVARSRLEGVIPHQVPPTGLPAVFFAWGYPVLHDDIYIGDLRNEPADTMRIAGRICESLALDGAAGGRWPRLKKREAQKSPSQPTAFMYDHHCRKCGYRWKVWRFPNQRVKCACVVRAKIARARAVLAKYDIHYVPPKAPK